MTSRGRKSEGGYALLLVYAMAASVAIMLYMEIPRVAFEAQRDKEQLLIDRGQQYTRAVQLYVRRFNRYPNDMNALENTQNIRFLRRQYVDPMTGKNEWRIVHVGPGGVFLDSLVHKKKEEAKPAQNFITEMQQIGSFAGNSGASEGVNLATRRRPSDGPGAQPDPLSPNGALPQSVSAPGSQPPGSQPPGSQPPMNGPVMVLPDGRIVPATSTGIPAVTAPAQPLNQPVAPVGQLPGGVGVQQGAQPTNAMPPGFQTTPNGAPGAPPQAAANLINQILTTPRPGGLNGEQGSPAGVGQPGTATSQGGFGTPVQGSTPGAGQTIGGGIAGVASKIEREGIKLFGDRSAYNEWEFVYDITKDPLRGGGAGRGGVLPQQGQQPGQSGQPGQPGQPATQQPVSPAQMVPGAGIIPPK